MACIGDSDFCSPGLRLALDGCGARRGSGPLGFVRWNLGSLAACANGWIYCCHDIVRGQRILPAFAGVRRLWSPRLMFAGLILLTLGCTIRIATEVLAYQEYANWAWSALPVSAILELAGITIFSINIFATFILEPSHLQKHSLGVGIN